MILSFHPNIVADKNRLCAGRSPDSDDLAAICMAKAVILPQGASETLYRMCRKHCPNVFPNYDVRYDFPGKLGQTRLFEGRGARFPRTYCFQTVSSYYNHLGKDADISPLGFPCVFKFDRGGEGEGVFLLKEAAALRKALEKAKVGEKSGQKGFLLQQYIPSGGRSLRVVVIGDQLYSYWRRRGDRSEFLANLKAGGAIDHESDPGLQQAGRAAVKDFCSKTGINLAGFDLIFSESEKMPEPYFLEINYFFGRRGLGGSHAYYELLSSAISKWLERIGLSL